MIEKPTYNLDSSFASVLHAAGELPAIPQPDQLKHLSEEIRNLVNTYGAALVWETLAETGLKEKKINKNDLRMIASSRLAESDEQQRILASDISKSESGLFGPVKDSFGLYRPSYEKIIASERERLAAQVPMNAALFGSMSEHSANEFFNFCRDINKNSAVTVIDLGTYWQKKADVRIKKIKGDVTQTLLADESQHLIATNMLLRYLRKDNLLPSAESIVSMLQQSYRSLKPGGLLLMNEYPLPYYQRGRAASWTTRLLLTEYLRSLGYSEVQSDFAISYPSHVAKRNNNREKLTDHGQALSDEEEKTWMKRNILPPERFAFTLLAKK